PVERDAVAHEAGGDGLVERLREGDGGLVAVGAGERDAPRVDLGRGEEGVDHAEPLHHVHGLPREGVAADLVAGEGVLVEEEGAEPLPGHDGGGGGPARPGAHDDGVVHAVSLVCDRWSVVRARKLRTERGERGAAGEETSGPPCRRATKKVRASDPHRAATTSYRCCLPALTEFRGSWPCGTCPHFAGERSTAPEGAGLTGNAQYTAAGAGPCEADVETARTPLRFHGPAPGYPGVGLPLALHRHGEAEARGEVEEGIPERARAEPHLALGAEGEEAAVEGARGAGVEGGRRGRLDERGVEAEGRGHAAGEGVDREPLAAGEVVDAVLVVADEAEEPLGEVGGVEGRPELVDGGAEGAAGAELAGEERGEVGAAEPLARPEHEARPYDGPPAVAGEADGVLGGELRAA